MKQPILEMRNITKKFGRVVANEDIAGGQIKIIREV